MSQNQSGIKPSKGIVCFSVLAIFAGSTLLIMLSLPVQANTRSQTCQSRNGRIVHPDRQPCNPPRSFRRGR